MFSDSWICAQQGWTNFKFAPRRGAPKVDPSSPPLGSEFVLECFNRLTLLHDTSWHHLQGPASKSLPPRTRTGMGRLWEVGPLETRPCGDCGAQANSDAKHQPRAWNPENPEHGTHKTVPRQWKTGIRTNPRPQSGQKQVDSLSHVWSFIHQILATLRGTFSIFQFQKGRK